MNFDYSFCDLGKSAGSVKSVVTVAAKGNKASIKAGKIVVKVRFY